MRGRLAATLILAALAMAVLAGCAEAPVGPAPAWSSQSADCRPDAVPDDLTYLTEPGDVATYVGWVQVDGRHVQARWRDTFEGVRTIQGPEGAMQVWEWTSHLDAIEDNSYLRSISKTRADACGFVQALSGNVAGPAGNITVWHERTTCSDRSTTSLRPSGRPR